MRFLRFSFGMYSSHSVLIERLLTALLDNIICGFLFFSQWKDISMQSDEGVIILS